MARRITRHREPNKDTQDAMAAANAARREAAAIGESTGAMREERDRIKSELEELDMSYSKKLKKLNAIDAEIDDKRLQLRELEGDVTNALAKCAEVELQTQKAIQDQAEATKAAQIEHRSVQESAEKRLAATQQTASEAAQRRDDVLKEVSVAEGTVAHLKQEEKRLRDIVQKIPEAERQLESLKSEELNKQLQLKDVEDKLASVTARYNSEKGKYDEAVALRTGEEQRVEELRQQLIEKEDEVEKKMRNLRQVQAGVDQATARLNRREQELIVKQHLTQKKELTEN
jgi:chromosome segregation ATPase